jgi:arginine/serine-rich splicing factor 7
MSNSNHENEPKGESEMKKSEDRGSRERRSRSRSRSRSSKSRSNARIYVGRLSRRTRAQDLRDAFGKFGNIKNVDLKSDYAFIEFEESKQAKIAIDKMDREELDDHRIIVEKAIPKRKSHGPSSQDVCFNCGLRGHW